MLIMFHQTACDAFQHHVTCCLKTFMELIYTISYNIWMCCTQTTVKITPRTRRRDKFVCWAFRQFSWTLYRDVALTLISVNNLKCNNNAPGNTHANFNHFQYLSPFSICCRHFCCRKTSREGAQSTKKCSVVCVC